MRRLLIAEDEPRLASFLEKGLRSSGFATTTVGDGEAAAAVARDAAFDLLLLDIGLPGRDGFAVLDEIRRRGERMPVIMLTAREEVGDKVAGLEGGADDYVTKPFRFEELLARVRARLRPGGGDRETVLEVGGIVLDLRSRRARSGAAEVELTAREFALLETFMRHPGQVLAREQLLSHVWGYSHDPGSNVVDVHVANLRRKLGTDAIVTLRGMGYRLRDS